MGAGQPLPACARCRRNLIERVSAAPSASRPFAPLVLADRHLSAKKSTAVSTPRLHCAPGRARSSSLKGILTSRCSGRFAVLAVAGLMIKRGCLWGRGLAVGVFA